MGPASDAFEKMGDTAEKELGKVGGALDENNKKTDKATKSLLDFGNAGIQPMNALIGLGVALGFVLLPLEAFTVGLAGALTLGALVVGGMAALGVGVVALAEHYGEWAEANKTVETAQKALTMATTNHDQAVRRLQEGEAALQNVRKPTEAQLLHLQDLQQKVTDTANALTVAQNNYNNALTNSHNPLTTLLDDLDAMSKRLGEDAVPAAQTLLTWIDSLIPKVETLGQRLIEWYTDRLPSAIPLATRLFDDTTEAVEKLGKVVGETFDRLLEHPQTFEKAYKEALDIVGGGIVWVIQKLQDLSDWWGQHGDELKTVAETSFKIIADSATALIGILGNLAIKFNEVERAAGDYANTLSNKLAPAQQDATKRTRDQQAALDALGGALNNLAAVLATPIRALADMGLEFADLIGKVLTLTDRFGGAGEAGRVLGEAGQFLVGELEAMIEAGFRAATPIWGLIDVFDRAASAIQWASDKFDEWRRKTSGGGPPGGGGGGIGGDLTAMQHGGYAPPGRWARVGEVAEELLYPMPGGGALVVPTGNARGGGNITINVNARSADIDERQLMGILRRHTLLYG